MAEQSPNQFENKDEERELKRKEIVALSKELAEGGESFPFHGIDPDAYVRIKAQEEEFPDYGTPIDELIERCKNEGIKVVTGKNPEIGTVYILPALSNDIINDSILPSKLQITEAMDEKLKKLILVGKEWFVFGR